MTSIGNRVEVREKQISDADMSAAYERVTMIPAPSQLTFYSHAFRDISLPGNISYTAQHRRCIFYR